MKYHFDIEARLTKRVEIEAASEAQAAAEIERQFRAGCLVLDSISDLKAFAIAGVEDKRPHPVRLRRLIEESRRKDNSKPRNP